jgi:TonB family protein
MGTVHYPFEARRRGIEGIVTIEVIVDATGAVRSTHIVSSPDPAMSEEVVKEAQTWKFAPGIVNGHYISSRLRVPVEFALGNPPLVLPKDAGTPDRPLTPITWVGDTPAKIVGYKGEDPVVELNGSRTTQRHSFVSVVPGRDFAPGVVVFEDANAGGAEDPVHPGETSYTHFSAKVTADRGMPDTFLMLIFYSATANGAFRQDPQAMFFGMDVGPLEAGKKKSISTDLPSLSTQGNGRYIAAIFSGGLQVRADSGNTSIDDLLEAFDVSDLKAEIAKRKSGDFPLSVFRHFPLKFSAELKQRLAGQTLNVRARVSPEGFFEQLDPVAPIDPALAAAASAQLRFWLFIPRIRGGAPQASTFVLPLKF